MRPLTCTELVPRSESVAGPRELARYAGLPWGAEPLAPCGRPGVGVTITRSADGHELAALGREPAVGGPYCAEHGGLERARRLAAAAWQVLAPASVGDQAAVQEAGLLALDSRAVYVVVRREADERAPDLWRVRCQRELAEAVAAAAGTDAARQLAPPVWHTREQHEAAARADYVARLAGRRPMVDHVVGGARPRPRPWVASIGIGGRTQHVGAYATREEALAHGREGWRVWVALSVRAIREARGGTLAWGLPVEPRPEPVLVEPHAGQTAYAAHRVAEILAAVPDAAAQRVPICARWINGTGTVAIEPHEATELATEIRGPAATAYVHDSDIVYVLPSPASPYRGCISPGSVNWSPRPAAEIAAALRGA